MTPEEIVRAISALSMVRQGGISKANKEIIDEVIKELLTQLKGLIANGKS